MIVRGGRCVCEADTLHVGTNSFCVACDGEARVSNAQTISNDVSHDRDWENNTVGHDLARHNHHSKGLYRTVSCSFGS